MESVPTLKDGQFACACCVCSVYPTCLVTGSVETCPDPLQTQFRTVHSLTDFQGNRATAAFHSCGFAAAFFAIRHIDLGRTRPRPYSTQLLRYLLFYPCSRKCFHMFELCNGPATECHTRSHPPTQRCTRPRFCWFRHLEPPLPSHTPLFPLIEKS